MQITEEKLQAATKIQAAFRGKSTRDKLKTAEPTAPSSTKDEEKRSEEPVLDESEYLDISRYFDGTPVVVNENLTIDRVHGLFRSLGMRHLIVVDTNQLPVGMITRKDLQAYKLQEGGGHGGHHHEVI